MKYLKAIVAWVKNIMGKLGKGNPFPSDVPTINLDSSAVNATEGSTLAVTVNCGNSPYTSTCYFYTIAGTAKETDYTAHNGTLVSFAPGETSKVVNVLISSDGISEPDETFIIQIANPNNAKIGVNKCVVTISGVDGPALNVTAVSNSSVDEGGNNVHTVSLSSSLGGTLPYSITNITTSSGDLSLPPTFNNGVTLLAGVLTVPNGVNSFAITILTVEDALVETNETYTITVGGINGTGTIVNDDTLAPATISTISSPAAVVEGLAVTFNVALSGPSIGQTFTPTFGGTATQGVDYGTFTFNNGVTLVGGTLNVPAGVSAFTASTTTTDDAAGEFSETITLTINSIVGTATITDNDAAPPLSPLTEVAVLEAPHGLLNDTQRGLVATTGGFPMFAASRKNAESPSFGVLESIDGVTFTMVLFDQAYTPSAACDNYVDYDHQTLSIGDEVNFPGTILPNTTCLLADSIGQKEWFYAHSVEDHPSGGDTSRVLKNITQAIFDSVPIRVDVDSTARIFVIGNTPSILNSVRAHGASRYYKIVPKLPSGGYLDHASTQAISLTIDSVVRKPAPVGAVKFSQSNSIEGALLWPEGMGSTNLYAHFIPRAKTDSNSSGFFNPSGNLDSGAVVKMRVRRTLDNVVLRTLTRVGSNPYIQYSDLNKNADDVPNIAQYEVFTEVTIGGGVGVVESKPFIWKLAQPSWGQNFINTAIASVVSTNVSILCDTDYSGSGSVGLGTELFFAYFELSGTLLANLNTAAMTFTNGAEFFEEVPTTTGVKFILQITNSAIQNFEVIIPYNATGATGRSLLTRAGSPTERTTHTLTIP